VVLGRVFRLFGDQGRTGRKARAARVSTSDAAKVQDRSPQCSPPSGGSVEEAPHKKKRMLGKQSPSRSAAGGVQIGRRGPNAAEVSPRRRRLAAQGILPTLARARATALRLSSWAVCAAGRVLGSTPDAIMGEAVTIERWIAASGRCHSRVSAQLRARRRSVELAEARSARVA